MGFIAEDLSVAALLEARWGGEDACAAISTWPTMEHRTDDFVAFPMVAAIGPSPVGLIGVVQ